MTHCIRNAIHGGHDNIDRISDLPGNVIDCILCHLPIRDIVRTSILSRKWRYMWVSVPQLEFGFDFFMDFVDRYIGNDDGDDNDDFNRDIGNQAYGIITNILLLHTGLVSKFTLEIPYEFYTKITCLSEWILLLSKRGIEDLNLVCHQDDFQKVPSHLFYYQGLKYLKLECFDLSIPPDFCGFKSLIDLHLITVIFEFGDLERLISSCPILGSLTIENGYGFNCINFSSPSLKVLSIRDLRNIKSICFTKAKNLTDLTLEILYPGFIPPLLQDSITSLKYLKLVGVNFNEPKELLFMASLLKSSPNLVELVIESYRYGLPSLPLANHQRAVDYYNSCCFSQLRKVDIIILRNAYEHELDLARFLLENSPSLNILTFKVWPGLKDYKKLQTIWQDLLQVERASPRAEVKFLRFGNT